ncbi:MAG: 5'/3'-nucleotidase SurE [Synechococcus sp. SB0678_bin_12]|nr:5'/3'-nucleotidase SurE [Synechococcus sp. SB0678_bin_12]MYI88397.1 5'/3'-nucleotidase SurE [Synechococcus sp. SB0672_bin_10]
MTKRHPVGLRILISNDDGIAAAGLRSLATACDAAGHSVDVVCPDRERSATSHCLTTRQAIEVKRVDDVFGGHIRAWACSGTPADAVKLGLITLLSEPPDLVLAGINHGPNLGCDVLYSGTVAAAMEGTLLGIPAMAVSSGRSTGHGLGQVTPWVLAVLQHCLARGWPPGVLLNMNLPGCAASRIRGVQWCRPCGRRHGERFQVQPSAAGGVCYTAGVEPQEEDLRHRVGPDLWPTDLACVEAGWIALTPLQPQLFWHGDPSTLPPLAPLSRLP